MPTDPLVLVAVAALVLGLLALFLPPRLRTVAPLLGVGVAVIAMTTAVVQRDLPVPEQLVEKRPVAIGADGYVGSSTCRSCHAHEHATWSDSYHSSMTQVATRANVLGDFEDVEIEHKGKVYRLSRDGDDHWVEMDDPVPSASGGTPNRVRRRIGIATGSHNMQVYWFESGFTRVMGLLPFSWQIEEQRWISRDASFVEPPDTDHSAQLSGWNMICIKCHATHGRPRLETDGAKVNAGDTQVAEFGIACEACHGPGAEHVAANRNPVRRYSQRLSDEPDPTIINPARLDHERSTQVCGQCHAWWEYNLRGSRLMDWFHNGFAYRPGGRADDNRELLKKNKPTDASQGQDRFWSDGLTRTAGREYNALVGSKCHDVGKMTCLSCHEMHPRDDASRTRAEWATDQLRLGDENRSCVECHGEIAADVTAHTHHSEGSSGSSCVNCHMPHTTYGLMKGVRTHRIESPSVRSTLSTGRPNACNQCHLDRPLAWTADHLKQWYGIDSPSLGSDNQNVSSAVRMVLEGDACQRALVAWAFGWPEAREASGSDWMVPYLAELVDDPYAAVRIIAERSLRQQEGFGSFRYRLEGKGNQQGVARSAALERWRAAGAVDAARPSVLLSADGAIEQSVYQRLLKQRDNRKIRLVE